MNSVHWIETDCVVESHNLCKKEKLKDIHTYTVIFVKTETSNYSNCREKSTIPEPSRWTPRPWGPPLRPRKTWTPRHCPCPRTQVRRHPHPTTLLVQALPKIGMPQIIHPRQKDGCTNGPITSKVKNVWLTPHKMDFGWLMNEKYWAED